MSNLSRSRFIKLALINSVVVLSACGGGGGGGKPAPRSVTPMPSFLQDESANERCVIESSEGESTLSDYVGSLSDIHTLNCANYMLNNFVGLNSLEGLKTLSLQYARISDISALTAFSGQLESLDLSGNSIDDFSPLSSMTNLTELNLTGTGLRDISWVSNLVQLKELNLSNNNLNDLSPLYALESLEALHLNSNRYLDCSEIALLSAQINVGGSGDIIVLPSQCSNAIFLDSTSTDSQEVDNSLETNGFDRVVLSEHTTDDITFVKQGDNLVLKITVGDGEKSITFINWFTESEYRVALFEFKDGVEYTEAQLKSIVPITETLTSGDDVWEGTEGYDAVDGNEGNDLLDGKEGNDVLLGGAGEDTLIGGDGADNLKGGEGDDQLIPDKAVKGESGEYIVSVDYDVDVIHVQPGGGHDSLIQAVTNSYPNIVVFDATINPDDVDWTKMGNDLVMSLSARDSVTFVDWYGDNEVRTFRFLFKYGGNESTEYATSRLNGITVLLSGATDDNDVLEGSSTHDTIAGGAGNDTLDGLAGNDTLLGEAGNDLLIGGDGSDTLTGGPGDDKLIPDVAAKNDSGAYIGVGDNDVDVIHIQLGGGHDSLIQAVTNSYLNIVEFEENINPENLTWTKIGNDLVATLSANDSVTFVDWYGENEVRTFRFLFKYGGNNSTEYATSYLNRIAVLLSGATDGNDVLEGSSSHDTIAGGAGNDTLDGLAGNDTLLGEAGNDLLIGGDGADTLTGGSGDDKLIPDIATKNNSGEYIGIADNDVDVIHVKLGDGHDRLIQAATNSYPNIVEFEETINPENITWTKIGNDLVATNSADDSITFVDWYGDNKIRSFRFLFRYGDNNSTVYATSYLSRIAVLLGGSTDSNDVLEGSSESDRIEGGLGNDTLVGGDGSDILVGGPGDDELIPDVAAKDDTGEYGTTPDNDVDVIYIKPGDGNDQLLQATTSSYYNIIEFDQSIDPSKVVWSKDGLNLTMTYGATDSITFVSWYSAKDKNNAVRSFKFLFRYGGNNAAVYATNHLNNIPVQIVGATDGDDVLIGSSESDRIEGGQGNDTLVGDDGPDILIGGLGNDVIIPDKAAEDGNGGYATTPDNDADRIYIQLGGGNDRLVQAATSSGSYYNIVEFEQTINPGSIKWSKDGDNLVASFGDGDSVIFVDWYNENKAIRSFKFLFRYGGNSSTEYATNYLNGVVVEGV